MPNQQSTLILFLLDRKGVPRFGAEKYLCGLIETPAPSSSFSLATFTPQDNKVNRAKIIALIGELITSATLDASQIHAIGERIWAHLGLGRFFSHLIENEREVTFLTNDSAIPWDWASEHGKGRSVCEDVSAGTVFFEQMDLTSQSAIEPRRRNPGDSHREQLLNMKAIILFDEGGHHKLPRLTRVEEEADSVRAELVGAGLDSTNIKLIDGCMDDHAEDTFLLHLRQMREDLGLIHFAGHVVNGDLQLKRSAIERSEIKEFFAVHKLPRTLVLINGCESGAIPDVWDKGKNLATAWLDAGAGGMIGCRLPVEDARATTFATSFYKNLLSRPSAHYTIGTVLRNTRRSLMTEPDATWLQYTLYGYPFAYFLAQLPSVSLAEAEAPSELRELVLQP